MILNLVYSFLPIENILVVSVYSIRLRMKLHVIELFGHVP
jgi:hypothetical protein